MAQAASYLGYRSKRAQLDALRAQLQRELDSFIPHYRELAEYQMPRRARFLTSDVNKGDKRNQKILDGTATDALATLGAGMVAGITSPARPWMRMATPDPDLNEYGRVKEWLDIVTKRTLMMFAKSNFYNACPVLYEDMGGFGTGCVLGEEDLSGRFMRFYNLPIGSYRLGNSDQMKVEVFDRSFPMTVRQIVSKFGHLRDSGRIDWAQFSDFVKREYEQGNYESWVDVAQVIQPNVDYDPRSPFARHKRFSDCYYETGTGARQGQSQSNYLATQDEDKYLLESGHDLFPVFAPRWRVTYGDVYGTDCPGMRALGDNKQLQYGEKEIAHAIAKMNKPPMVAHPDLRQTGTSILPGDVTYADERDGQKRFRSAYETIRPPIEEMERKQEQKRQALRRWYYADLFLMLQNDQRNERATAREIAERSAEKLIVLGPMMEQLNESWLDPVTDFAYMIGEAQGVYPEPPEELQGQEIKVEYVSIMAQAQRLVGLESLDRMRRMMGELRQIFPDDPTVADKFDADQYIDEYSAALGAPISITRSDEKVVDIRSARNQAQSQQARPQDIATMAGAARDLSQAELGDGQSALTELMNQARAGQAVPA